MTQILSPSHDIECTQFIPFAGLDIALFFQSELRKLMEDYDYTEKDYRMFLSWHQPRDIVEKILDPNRFFRIIRDEAGTIIGYFESRQKDEITEVVQWVLIDESHRGSGLSTMIWNEFFIYCQSKGRKAILSFAKSGNKISCNMHASRGFLQIDDSNGELTFRKELSR